MKRILVSVIALSILLPLFFCVASTNEVAAAPTQSTNKVFLGLSGYPTSTQQVQNIINTMKSNGLNTFRMSFNPEWSRGPHPYHEEYIQYFLDNSDYTIIVDRNHLYPPTEASATSARNNWATVRNSIFEVLETFPNNERVIVELINEYISNDFYSRMQNLVTEVRKAGYTNGLLFNKWNQAWTKVNDPLDNTYQGYHYYFNSWSPSGAISQMQTAQSKGIKLINTEVGADFNEHNSYTTATVNELNQFLAQCTSMGIGNTVWMNENLNNMPRYQQLGLGFPSVSAPTNSANHTPTTTPRPTPTAAPTPRPTVTSIPTSNPTSKPTTKPSPEPTTPSETTIIFQDGFESRSTGSWSKTITTYGNKVAVTSNAPYEGNYNALFYTSGSSRGRENAFLRKNVYAKDAYASAEFRIDGNTCSRILQDNDDRMYLLRFTNRYGSDLALAGIRRENEVNKWILFTGERAQTSTAVPISTDQWYDIGLYWNSESNIAELYINDKKILSMTATKGDTSAATYVDMGIIYTYQVQNELLVYGDNFKLSTTP